MKWRKSKKKVLLEERKLNHTNCPFPFLIPYIWFRHSSAHFGFITRINFCKLIMHYLLFRRNYFLFCAKALFPAVQTGKAGRFHFVFWTKIGHFSVLAPSPTHTNQPFIGTGITFRFLTMYLLLAS